MKYIIFGAKGQLGRELAEQVSNYDIKCMLCDIPKYDISNFSLTSKLISAQQPDVVINCAAFTNVDAAEFEYENAYKVNAAGVENLSIICKRENCKFVHISTDYVFDGNPKITGLYTEAAPPKPLNNYGKTKLEGEFLIQKILPEALILRTSWLYNANVDANIAPNNFIAKVLKWANEKDTLKGATDEISVPTSVRVVASTLLKAINGNLMGLYHLVCSGYCSRYDWMKVILENANIEINLLPAKAAEFNILCSRPLFTAMDNTKISEALQITLPNWKDEFLDYMKSERQSQSKLH